MRLILLLFTAIFISSCNFDPASPLSEQDPFYYGQRTLFDGYTYTNNFGNYQRNLNINFTSIGSVGYIYGEQAYGIIDSTFQFSSFGQGYLIRLDTLYFNRDVNGDVRFLSFGYYRVAPKWIYLYRSGYVNSGYVQEIDEVIDNRYWKVTITSYINTTTVYTGFGSVPAYRIEQRLQYREPFVNDYTFIWYWSEEHGLIAYDEQRSGLIYQVAREKSYY